MALTRRGFIISSGCAIASLSGCRIGNVDESSAARRSGGVAMEKVGFPCLQAPGDTTMGVSWSVPCLSKGEVEVADNPEMRDARIFRPGGLGLTPIDDSALSVRLTGLKPSTRYWYRTVTVPFVKYGNIYTVEYGPVVRSDVNTFMTLGENSPSHFCMMADTHAKWDSFGLVVRKIKELSPAAIVWNGDATNRTQDRRTAAEIFLNPPVEDRDYASRIPVLFENGNHDFRGSWISRKEEVVMPRLPTERLARHWELKWNFAVRCGEMALIGMDTGEDKPDSDPALLGLANYSPYRRMQTEWLEDQFRRPEISRAPYKILFCHIPLWGRENRVAPKKPNRYGDWIPECYDLWAPIFERNGVQLVVAGHRHCYSFLPAFRERPWAMVVGGSPEFGLRYDRTSAHMVPAADRFPTVVEGKVIGGKLRLRVYDVSSGQMVLDQDVA